MKALIYIAVMSSLLVACSGGGSASSESQDNDSDVLDFNPQDFVITQSTQLTSYGKTQVTVNLQNLPTDDAIYVTTKGVDIDGGKLNVKPLKTLLNPTSGQASLILEIEDQGALQAPSIEIDITTASNRKMKNAIELDWAN